MSDVIKRGIINVDGGENTALDKEGKERTERPKEVGDRANIVFQEAFDSGKGKRNDWQIADFDDEKGVVVIANDLRGDVDAREVPYDKFWQSNFEGSDEIYDYLWDLRSLHKNKVRNDLRVEDIGKVPEYKEAANLVEGVIVNFSEGDLESVRDFIESRALKQAGIDSGGSIEDVRRKYEDLRRKEENRQKEEIKRYQGIISAAEGKKAEALKKIEDLTKRGGDMELVRHYRDQVIDAENEMRFHQKDVQELRESLNKGNYGRKEMAKHIKIIETIDRQLNQQNN